MSAEPIEKHGAPPLDVRRYLPVVIQLIGVLVVAVGFGLLTLWAGVIAGGIGLMIFGVAAELSER
jgi:hypothetical protein